LQSGSDQSYLSPFRLAEYQARQQKTLVMLEQERLDALVCYASKIIPGNVRYLTGYETRLGVHDAAFFLIVPGAQPEFTLLTNASWQYRPEESWASNVVLTNDFGNELAARLPASAKRLGVAGYRYLPLPVYLSLKTRFPDVAIVDATQALMRLRSVKSTAEVDVLRRCARLTDCGGHAFLESVRAGATEREIAAAVEHAMKHNGSDEVSFTTQVGAGESTSRVVIYPSDKVLTEGDPVQLDCGATCWGYRGDLSRVKVIGTPAKEYRRMLDAVEEMYLACLNALRPGVVGAEIARIGINMAKAHHLEDFLYRSPNHGTGFMGHGIGCHYSELPELTPDDVTVLEENMILVVEPILMRPGVGGVKIEDAVLITSSGAERFSSCDIKTWV
jgi:Xaa-Pro aminopeptidase